MLTNKIMYKREKFPITKELIEFFTIGSEILIINNLIVVIKDAQIFSHGLWNRSQYFKMLEIYFYIFLNIIPVYHFLVWNVMSIFLCF